MPNTDLLLAANRLIHQYGEHAEEHAAAQLWAARQAQDQAEAAKWQSLIEAIREVRNLRNKV